MLIGPIFHREVVIAPRRVRLYVARSVYVAALLTLMFTAWLVVAGTQRVRDVGDMARFGMTLFQVLAPLQLALAVFFSAMLAASAVAQEKDRRTLVLLLLTNLSNCELVLGKLLASLLNVLVMLAAALPLFMLLVLLGGVSFGQIARVFAVTLASVLACGSLGSTLALWREKTFQALAMTVLALVLWLAVGEVVAAGAVGDGWWGLSRQVWSVAISPWQAILEASRPYVESQPALGLWETPVYLFLAASVAMSAVLNAVAIARVRVWNPSREVQAVRQEERSAAGEGLPSAAAEASGCADNSPLPLGEGQGVRDARKSQDTNAKPVTATRLPTSPHPAASPPPSPTRAAAARGRGDRTRRVWDNPILWREVRTWAYGRKTLLIRLAFLALFGLAAASLYWMVAGHHLAIYAGGAVVLAPLLLLSLVLVNAQAVTSITSERDARALDLLLVTDLTPKEVVFGKLGGVFYNTKEMVLLPLLLCGYLHAAGALSLENLVYLLGGLVVMYVFAATLGIHVGMTYANSRIAIATSLGTLFFLSVGVATCMRMLVAFSAFRGAFQVQLLPFSALVLGGGVGLYAALGARNPSTAIGVASFLCPLFTFYAITSYLLGSTLAVFLVTVGVYGFTTAAMLVPAVCEFDVATGRTTAED